MVGLVFALCVPRSGLASEDGVPLDPLFAQRHEVTATVASGVPFLGIAELAFAVSDRFSIGLFSGATPDLATVQGTLAVGLRPRGVLLEKGPWRATVVAPILFYPQVRGFGDREPWFLVRPTAGVERELGAGARIGFGAGIIAAACADSILTLGKEPMMGGVWETIGISGSLPIAAHTSLFADVSVVTKGTTLAKDWIGITPIIAYAGISTRLF
jgi:hypothetical protein